MKAKSYIFDMMNRYALMGAARFHFPGHKGKKAIYGKKYTGDITELSFSDCLGNPTGVIDIAEDNIAATLGAKRSYLLTDGATSGILSMIYAVRDLGNKIVISRNSHQSVYNACRLAGLEPYFIGSASDSGLTKPPTRQQVETAINLAEASGSNGRRDKVAAVLITSYDYYGFAANLKEIKEVTDAKGKLLLVDNAHGAHIRFTNPANYAGNYASAWVDGVHKSMPALTQGAILSVNSDRYGFSGKVNEAVNIFRTSSPSYLIMGSIEYAISFYRSKGLSYVKKFAKKVRRVKDAIEKMGFVTVENADFYKIIIDFEKCDMDPYSAEEVLEKAEVFCEMNDGRYLVFAVTPMNSPADFKKLKKGLLKVQRANLYGTYKPKTNIPNGARKVSFCGASRMQHAEVDLMLAIGKVSAVNIGTFPPCSPMVVAGETITREIASELSHATNVYGLRNGKVKIVLPDAEAQRLGEQKRKEEAAKKAAAQQPQQPAQTPYMIFPFNAQYNANKPAQEQVQNITKQAQQVQQQFANANNTPNPEKFDESMLDN